MRGCVRPATRMPRMAMHRSTSNASQFLQVPRGMAGACGDGLTGAPTTDNTRTQTQEEEEEEEEEEEGLRGLKLGT